MCFGEIDTTLRGHDSRFGTSFLRFYLRLTRLCCSEEDDDDAYYDDIGDAPGASGGQARCQLHNLWPLISAKFTQFTPVFGEKALKKRPFNMKYAAAEEEAEQRWWGCQAGCDGLFCGGCGQAAASSGSGGGSETGADASGPA